MEIGNRVKLQFSRSNVVHYCLKFLLMQHALHDFFKGWCNLVCSCLFMICINNMTLQITQGIRGENKDIKWHWRINDDQQNIEINQFLCGHCKSRIKISSQILFWMSWMIAHYAHVIMWYLDWSYALDTVSFLSQDSRVLFCLKIQNLGWFW